MGQVAQATPQTAAAVRTCISTSATASRADTPVAGLGPPTVVREDGATREVLRRRRDRADAGHAARRDGAADNAI
jgi:hypothetical protein